MNCTNLALFTRLYRDASSKNIKFGFILLPFSHHNKKEDKPMTPRKSWKKKRNIECYGAGTRPKHSNFIIMIIILMMNFLIFLIILNYKLFNFLSQNTSFYFLYTHHNNINSKKFRSEFSFYCVHILIFSVKVILVCQAEACCQITVEINNWFILLNLRCLLQTCRSVITYLFVCLASTQMSDWNLFQCSESRVFIIYLIRIAKTIKNPHKTKTHFL